MPYAIHLRKSRADLEAEARGEGESLARHRKTLYALADRLGLEVGEEYCEIISGERLSERPEMQRLLRDVAAGRWDGVLDVAITRITRGDLMDQGTIINTFKYSGTKIITPEHTFDLSDDWQEDVLTSDMMMSRREYKYIKKRLQSGRLSSASEGLWQSPAPFGYRKVKIQRGKGWTLEPDPETAPLLRMIFEMYANENLGGQRIADRLNALGSRTTKGNPWTESSIRQLSANPVYIGKVRWNDRVSVTRFVDGEIVRKREKSDAPILADGKHPPLISVELWEAAQRARRSHDHPKKKKAAKLQNPFSGLIFCAFCGKAIVRKDNVSNFSTGGRYSMMRCLTKDCPSTSIDLVHIEKAVLDTLALWLVQFGDTARQDAPKTNPRQEAIDAAQANLARLRTQRERIFAAFEDGAYDSATFVRRRSDKDGEIAAAQAALDELLADNTPSAEDCIRMQLPAIRTALELYSAATEPEDKNRILKSVISRIEYKKTVRCYRNQDPSQYMELIITPALPSS